MNNTATRCFSVVMSLMVLLGIFTCNIPVAQAMDPQKIILPAVGDKSGYNSSELNSALLNKLRSQFRFPKYEVLIEPALTVAVKRPELEKLVLEKAADSIVNLEISQLKHWTRTSFFDHEIYEETSLSLTLTYYDKKSGQYGRLTADRSVTELASVFSGPLPVSLSALEEILNRLDKVFPRQFPGPRY
jgi:hypothetical protein